VSRHVFIWSEKCRDMGGIAWSGIDVHNGPTSFIAVERTALPGGFFMSAI
jgi:hypothetical protein